MILYNFQQNLVFLAILQIVGGRIEDSQVIKGVVLNKDVTHAKMFRRKEKPRIVLLDCNLEYKKGESQMSLEIMKEEDFSKVLKQVCSCLTLNIVNG